MAQIYASAISAYGCLGMDNFRRILYMEEAEIAGG